MTTWFITGCSTGFGRALAEAVLERGDNAVITARNADVLGELAAKHPATALALALDVTDAAQVAAAVRAAEDRFGGIDVLVNNAGHGYRAAVEEGEDAAVRELFETNFFGLVEVTKRVLPGMRGRRSGVIVNLSSIAGRTAPLGSGYYAASKYAVEGLSGSLRLEVQPLGIRVIVVEPGGFRTDFAGRSLGQSAEPIADYASTAGTRRKSAAEDGSQPGDPAKFAQAVIDAVESAEPPFRLLLGSDALARTRAELAAQTAEVEAWADVSASTDFPD
ncbi:oxidoreductase [Gryllotalpicola protaetiae]|uniref:SDR family NAD(P)-dependent oxidoreductase n=1 Tax=Gryllotalpicola protaetiae TaxID=2419771 RepID=A0A387BQQ8_9MICO|nr:oxidoreductase [Gryllotalpicola protaetiae]AYG03327.1 SDR family NAD(P)-dependent oxidoreductase [Gryllotalpicola protaetiae]